MKQGHLALMFISIYFICFLLLYLEKEQYDNVQKEKQKIEQALTEAMTNAGREYTSAINSSEDKRKQAFEQAFFKSIYISMGIFDETEKQEELKMYLPMLILAEEDGAFFYHTQELSKGEVVELKQAWTEKVSYGFSENITQGEKKSVVAEALEKKASEIISNHNYIASQYGISYSFSVPGFLQDSSKEMNFPVLLVVFQGWPLTAAGNIVYENCLDAGVYLREVERYVVAGPENLWNAVCLYHNKSCPDVMDKESSVCQDYVTKEEAIKIFGAYPCEKCIP